MENIQIVWLVLMVVFIAVEAATVGLASIWFAGGALVALLASFMGAKSWLQIVLFFVVSVATLFLTRPLAKKYLNARVQHTNADKVIGETAIVTKRIDNVEGTGMATVGGRLWTARSANGEIIEENAVVRVKALEGVKILVAPEET
ncbi:MAG: NfeD family protein [Oscillospiraceae bacterium]|jgi:membrane protein implicated in regulation of membrane protease activity|nr:NfeD family protein [Oscillospiraceae bacterium]